MPPGPVDRRGRGGQVCVRDAAYCPEDTGGGQQRVYKRVTENRRGRRRKGTAIDACADLVDIPDAGGVVEGHREERVIRNRMPAKQRDLPGGKSRSFYCGAIRCSQNLFQARRLKSGDISLFSCGPSKQPSRPLSRPPVAPLLLMMKFFSNVVSIFLPLKPIHFLDQRTF